MNKLDMEEIRPLLKLAIEEDLGLGDMTSELLFGDNVRDEADIISREEIVVCGMNIVKELLRMYDSRIKLKVLVRDGQHAYVGCRLATLIGSLRSILTAERVVLNFLQQLSAIATVTAAYVKAVAGTGAKIYDTRKTTPGWRELEKYAVRCGGGENHRQGLYDAVLIKDNHLAGWEGKELGAVLKEVIGKIRSAERRLDFIQVEVDTSEQLRCVLGVEGVDIVLLDNFTPKQLREAVAVRDEMTGKDGVQLEASGGVTLSNVRPVSYTHLRAHET